jgi:hypothetical protein
VWLSRCGEVATAVGWGCGGRPVGTSCPPCGVAMPGQFVFLFFSKRFAESRIWTTTHVCREPQVQLTANEPFAVKLFAVSASPRAVHDRVFAESKLDFVVSIRLTAKPRSRLVIVLLLLTQH